MKILVISYDYFPENTPNTYRWESVINEWARDGHEVYVLSGLKSNLNSFQEINGVKIHRTGEGKIGKLKYSYNNSEVNILDFETNRNKQYSFFKKIIKYIYNYSWAKLYWPDYAFLWYFTAVPKAKEIILNENIDKIVSVSWPFTSHLIGYKLKDENPSLQWLADTIDPFCFNDYINNQQLYKKINYRIERKIFNKADVISVLTDNLKNKYSSIFPESKDKIKVNKNIYVPQIFDFNKLYSNDVVKIVFVGMLSDSVRSPYNILSILKNIITISYKIKVEIHFYGDVSQSMETFDMFNSTFNYFYFLHGKKETNEINAILKEADILLNIGNNNEYQEPSKIIEYMYTGKPILNVCSIINDSSLQLLKEYPASLSVLPHEINDSDLFEKILKLKNTNFKINKNYLDHRLKDYLLPSIQSKYLSFLNSTS